MTMRCFEACSIYTTDQLEKTIMKFEDPKPPYVFMERIFMVNEVPRAYLFRFPSLDAVSQLRAHALYARCPGGIFGGFKKDKIRDD